MVHFAALPAIPSQQGMLLDIQCTGHSIVAVANVPGRVYAMNPEETCQWRELQLEAGFEPVLCAAVGSGFALLGRHGGYWAVSSNGAKAVQILIPQGMVPIGFAWFDDRWGIVCEKERSPDQEIIICDSSGILLARVVLP
jgi:hypothetical protein